MLGANNIVGGIRPNLLFFVDKEHHFSGFDLETENLSLFSFLSKLNNHFGINDKRTDGSKEQNALVLNKALVERFLQTTKEVWLWFGKHWDAIPEGQLSEFEEDFCSLWED